MTGEGLYVMSPMEIVCGYVFGKVGAPRPPTGSMVSPREALEVAIRDALVRPPCGVAFSGGRDSSVVLAIATHVARRDGLPEPIALTHVFADEGASDESSWQELVIRHLGLREWQRIPIQDELDVVGPLAQQHLLQHGVVWPGTIARDTPLVDLVRGGALLDGEGGDEVLGDETHRIAPLAGLIRHTRPIRWRRLQAAVSTAGPASMRARHLHRFWGVERTPWLRPAGRMVLLDSLSQVERARPLSFAASVRNVPLERHHVLAARNRAIFANRRDVKIHSPLVDPQVVDALARHGGPLGPGTRTAVLRSHVADLLPGELLSRTSKADFTNCYMGRITREFAARWDGVGVDDDYVDAHELRRVWLGAEQHALTAALLQQAWIASKSTMLRS